MASSQLAKSETAAPTRVSPNDTVKDKATLKSLLDDPDMIESIQTVIPKHLTPERILKMALVAASREPKLFKCTKASILQSVMRAAELGLDCSGTTGKAYLVPYWNGKIKAYEAQFIPGYRGLIELATRSGRVLTIEAHCVYEKDEFDPQMGTNPNFVHRPYLDGPRGKLRCVYAIARLAGNVTQCDYMTLDEVEYIHSKSPSKDSLMWREHFGEGAKKTVTKRLCKYVPSSPELERALAAESEAEGAPRARVGDGREGDAVHEVRRVGDGRGSRTDSLVDELLTADVGDGVGDVQEAFKR